MDRIVLVIDIDLEYKSNIQIDFAEYFEDIIGVTIDNEAGVELIKLKITNTLYPYIQTKPIHGSQKLLERGENHTLITLEIILNYELESLVLSYGEGVEVVSPLVFRERISKRAQSILKNYKS